MDMAKGKSKLNAHKATEIESVLDALTGTGEWTIEVTKQGKRTTIIFESLT